MPLTIAQTQQIWRIQNNERKRYFNKYSRIWYNYYISQGKILIENIDKPNPENYIFKESEVQNVFVQMYKDVGTHFAGLSFLNVKSSVNNLNLKQIDYALTWEQEMQQYANQYGAQSVVSISATGIESARRIIQSTTAEAIEQGLSVDELAELLESRINEQWKILGKFNAERIARTEIIAASNEGAWVGAKSTGLNLQKTWMTALDGRERETHAQANNQTVGMNDRFNVGGVSMSKPGDKTAPAEEVINCRCAVGFSSVDIFQSTLTDFS